MKFAFQLARAWLLGFRDSEPFGQEDLVHVFQAAPSGLRVEEVRDGDEACVENGPNNVELVSEILNGNRCHVNDHKVGQPVGADTHGDTLVPSAKWHDFRSVHPADGKNAPGENVEEEESEGHEGPLSLIRTLDGKLQHTNRGDTYRQCIDVQHHSNHHHAE